MKRKIPDFVHLHTHSEYSILDSTAKIYKMVRKAVSMEMKHLALTDHDNLFGAIEFYNSCKAEGVNPIIGCEITIKHGESLFHLIILEIICMNFCLILWYIQK